MDLDSFSDQEITAKTGWAEDRSGGSDGMQAVINSGQNRLASGVSWWGNTLRTIFLHPFQYSCWLDSDPNRPKLLAVTTADPQYAIAMQLAAAALAGNLPDLTGGADSYYALSMPTLPKWAEGLAPTATIGGQVYFKTLKTYIGSSIS